jgi:cytochrome c oxidase subunit 3
MAHAVLDEPKAHMGLPLPNGKLAMWLFLVTEIMFFTGLIGTYIILRNGTPSEKYPWPHPHDVHLAEWMGAVNTFVLICSSLTVVLGHMALSRGNVKAATQYIAVTLALGVVFLAIKAVEYTAKFEHGILPGRIYERLEGQTGPRFIRHVEEQLKEIVADPRHNGANDAVADQWKSFLAVAEAKTVEKTKFKTDVEKELAKAKTDAEGQVAKIDEDSKLDDKAKSKAKKDIDVALRKKFNELNASIAKSDKTLDDEIESSRAELVKAQPSIGAVADSWAVLKKLPNLSAKKLNIEIVGSENKHLELKPCDEVEGYHAKGLLESYPDLHVSHAISFGNLWASCYFAMTGFHALHVLGGLVIFVIILIMSARGRLNQRHDLMLELTGLYWHFVDVVWIFLFPLLYLV